MTDSATAVYDVDVCILGGGIAGLAAAHDLVVTGGFKGSVLIVEQNSQVGGQARSSAIDGAQLPIEYCSRIYGPGYEAVRRLMKQTPLMDKGCGKTVHDNLVDTVNFLVARTDNNLPGIPGSFRLNYSLSALKNYKAGLKDVSWSTIYHIFNRFSYALTSSETRIEHELADQTWYDFMNIKDDKARLYVVDAMAPFLGVDMYKASAHSVWSILECAINNTGNVSVLNGPTSHAWFRHWRHLLQSHGVKFANFVRVKDMTAKLDIDGQSHVESVLVESLPDITKRDEPSLSPQELSEELRALWAEPFAGQSVQDVPVSNEMGEMSEMSEQEQEQEQEQKQEQGQTQQESIDVRGQALKRSKFWIRPESKTRNVGKPTTAPKRTIPTTSMRIPKRKTQQYGRSPSVSAFKLNASGSGVTIRARYFVSALPSEAVGQLVELNPFTLGMFPMLKQIPRLAELGKQKMVGIVLFWGDELTFDDGRTWIHLAESPWQLVIEPQQAVWSDEENAIWKAKAAASSSPADRVVKSIWSIGICDQRRFGGLVKRPWTECTREEIAQEVHHQILQSEGLIDQIRTGSGVRLDKVPLVRAHLWDSYQFPGDVEPAASRTAAGSFVPGSASADNKDSQELKSERIKVRERLKMSQGPMATLQRSMRSMRQSAALMSMSAFRSAAGRGPLSWDSKRRQGGRAAASIGSKLTVAADDGDDNDGVKRLATREPKFSPNAETWALRPTTRVPNLKNLYLAGAWVRSENVMIFMEAAASTGSNAASALLVDEQRRNEQVRQEFFKADVAVQMQAELKVPDASSLHPQKPLQPVARPLRVLLSPLWTVDRILYSNPVTRKLHLSTLFGGHPIIMLSVYVLILLFVVFLCGRCAWKLFL